MNRDRYQKKGEGGDSNRENEKNTGKSRSSIKESLREDILSILPKCQAQFTLGWKSAECTRR